MNCNSKIKYTVSMENPNSHIFKIKIELNKIKTTYIDFKMPVWTPGSYLIREFSKNVIKTKAVNNKKLLKTYKISKNTWRIETKNIKSILFEYSVYAFEKTVRTSYLDNQQAMINGASIFMIADGYENEKIHIIIKPYQKWKSISTTLDQCNNKNNHFCAKNFDELIDSPIEIGNHKIIDFQINKIKHQYIITSSGNINYSKLIEDSTKIIAEIQSLFKDSPPYKYYIFFLHLTDGNFGGLEHSNSSSLIFDRNSFNERKNYLRFLSLVSHEYFHTWNVKRIRPIELGPFDYYNEVYTNLLWIAEGVTSYYDNLFLARSKIASAEEYFEIICNDLLRYKNTPGRKIMTLEESSFDAWIKLYRPNENSSNSGISYYLKGSLVIMILDLYIRNKSKNKKSLDNVYIKLWNKYKLDKKGINAKEFKLACESEFGGSLETIWDLLNTTKKITLSKYLKPFGLSIKGQYSKIIIKNSAWFGLEFKQQSTIIKSVRSDSPAYHSEVYANDELIAINNIRLNSNNISRVISNIKVNKKATLILSRDGLIKSAKCIPITHPYDKYVIIKNKKPTTKQIQSYEKWLKQSWHE